MQLSCHCLNIFINSKSAFFSKDEHEPKIWLSFTKDPFFVTYAEDLRMLPFCIITSQVSNLLKEDEAGPWRIIGCINCNTPCYATYEGLDAGTIVVRKTLQVNTNEIMKIKQSFLFSPIFKIQIRTDLPSDDEPGEEEKTTLYPIARKYLNEQAVLTEERIRAYSDKEYEELDKLRTRAYWEQRIINRLAKERIKETGDIKKDSVEDLSKKFQKASLTGNKSKRTVSRTSIEDSTYDGACFLLEGVEDENNDYPRDDDSDSDDLEEAASLRPRRTADAQVAKSLPIPVPQLMEGESQSDELVGSSEVPTDIAASIKALAQSVHGDAIFGELPPPRFSTHL